MNVAINKILFPVSTLGYGRRVGIWMQGCSIRCPGCLSKDTWEFREENCIEIEHLFTSRSEWLSSCDGVTVSGGEPFDQPAALLALVTRIRDTIQGDILVYSGYRKERIVAQWSSILEYVDVLISEPYVESVGQSLVLRGSDNQRVTLFTPLARLRYPMDIDCRLADRDRRLDVLVDGETVWIAGIPHSGDMAVLRDLLKQSGLECRTSDIFEVAVRP